MDRFASANQSGQMAGYIWNMKARQAREADHRHSSHADAICQAEAVTKARDFGPRCSLICARYSYMCISLDIHAACYGEMKLQQA